jgi:regulator of sigma E protease
MNTFFGFVLTLGLLIFVHELGHFLFAKLFGVRVLKFSLGFGPKMVGKTIGETEYVISAIPLGGFVKMFGENPDEQDIAQAERDVSFAHKTVWQRFFIVLAGPMFNMLFPIVLFFSVFVFMGVPDPVETTRIGQVIEGSPAEIGGVMAGDTILQIGETKTDKWLDVLETVKGSGGKELTFTVLRGGDQLQLRLVPEIDTVRNDAGEEVEQRYMIGIMRADDFVYKNIGLVESFKMACWNTWRYISLTAEGVYKLFRGDVPASELGGPIMIAKIAGDSLDAGWIYLLNFIGLLSVNLGILNLLPIPILDGGHLVFLGIEALRRKPLGERAQIFAQQIGIGLLATLMIFVFYNDIARLVKEWIGAGL